MLKLAFMGFRHGHILGLYKRAQEMPGCSVVAACEEDPETRASLERSGAVTFTHADYGALLDQSGCDAVAIGDYYGRRGAVAIAALTRGKHVIADKPLCTSLEELDQIAGLSAKKRLSVGLQLDLRDAPVCRKAQELVQAGAIGPVHGVVFTAEHPLNLGKRPAWYFEKGKHGGTINDIGIHAFDLIPWIAGQPFARLEAARSWNAFATDTPWMHDAGQFMARLANGAGVMGEVSYFMPDSLGYSLPPYWRLTFFGRTGLLEITITQNQLLLAQNGAKAPIFPELPPENPGGYLKAFLAEIEGHPLPGALSTADVLRASRVSLLVQKHGEAGTPGVAL